VTERQKRLKRLASLCEQEHTRSISSLHLAQQQLLSVEHQIQATIAENNHSCAEQVMALIEDSHDMWLMALAEEGMSRLALAQVMRQRSTREQAVADAMQRELEARRALQQIDHLTRCMRNEEAVIEARKEQQQMDECARLIRSTMKHSVLG